jgi:Fe-S-cluster containining protein
MSDNKSEINQLILNKQIAYAGDIGQRRRQFCIDFIKKKQGIFKEMQDSQSKAIKEKGQQITCHRGCAHCCHYYMHANIQECEAIVYYLYNNADVYEAYLKNYTVWRRKLRENGDIFKNCAQLWYEKRLQGAGAKEEQAFNDESDRYRDQGLACPFLVDGACSIYEVRPYMCVGTISSSPGEWCAKGSINTPIIYKTQTSAIFDTSFYYKDLNDYILTFFPITVFHILENGYKMLELITGISGLEEKALNAPEVKVIMEKSALIKQATAELETGI